MVAITDVQKINQLYSERTVIATGLQMLDAGEKITAFGLGRRAPPFFVTIDADYPQQMVESIKTIMRTRQQAISTELRNLGLTEEGANARKR